MNGYEVMLLMLVATNCSAAIVCMMYLESFFSTLLDKGQWRDDNTLTPFHQSKSEADCKSCDARGMW